VGDVTTLRGAEGHIDWNDLAETALLDAWHPGPATCDG